MNEHFISSPALVGVGWVGKKTFRIRDGSKTTRRPDGTTSIPSRNSVFMREIDLILDLYHWIDYPKH
jgi:hypothetical protein